MQSGLVQLRFGFARGLLRSFRNLVLFGLFAVPGVTWSLRAEESAKVDFNFQIRPLLSDRCFRCHGPDSGARKAKLRLDQRDGALKELDDSWAIVGKEGFEPVRMVAIDEDWSGLRVRRVEFIKKMTRKAEHAMSSERKKKARGN